MATFVNGGDLASTGSNILPWLIGAGVIVVLGVIALVVSSVVRERRAVSKVVDAAAAGGEDAGRSAADTDAADAVGTDPLGGPETPPESNESDGPGSISPDDPR